MVHMVLIAKYTNKSSELHLLGELNNYIAWK